MRDVRDILYDFKIALEDNDYVEMIDLIAEDTGSAIKGKRIDIYMNSEGECKSWGIRDLEIIILK